MTQTVPSQSDDQTVVRDTATQNRPSKSVAASVGGRRRPRWTSQNMLLGLLGGSRNAFVAEQAENAVLTGRRSLRSGKEFLRGVLKWVVCGVVISAVVLIRSAGRPCRRCRPLSSSADGQRGWPVRYRARFRSGNILTTSGGGRLHSNGKNSR
jgi:hypothetical protein